MSTIVSIYRSSNRRTSDEANVAFHAIVSRLLQQKDATDTAQERERERESFEKKIF